MMGTLRVKLYTSCGVGKGSGVLVAVGDGVSVLGTAVAVAVFVAVGSRVGLDVAVGSVVAVSVGEALGVYVGGSVGVWVIWVSAETAVAVIVAGGVNVGDKPLAWVSGPPKIAPMINTMTTNKNMDATHPLPLTPLRG